MSLLPNEERLRLCSPFKAATHSQPPAEQECPQGVLRGKTGRQHRGFCRWLQLQAPQWNVMFNAATQIFVSDVSICFWTRSQVFPQALVSLSADSERHLWRQRKAFAAQHLYQRTSAYLVWDFRSLILYEDVSWGVFSIFWQFKKGAFPLNPKERLCLGWPWGQQQGEPRNLTRPFWQLSHPTEYVNPNTIQNTYRI